MQSRSAFSPAFSSALKRSALKCISGFVFSLGAAFTIVIAASNNATAADNIVISHPYARATVPGQPSGGAYISIENKGKETDTLKSLSSSIAKSTELHTMTMDGGVMKMREVGTVDIKPSEKIAMQPGGGYHIMLIGLTKPLKSGDHFPLTLTFAKAGKIEVNVEVEAFNSNAGDKNAGHMH
jgi:copper(I)-binding protein